MTITTIVSSSARAFQEGACLPGGSASGERGAHPATTQPVARQGAW